MDRLSKFLEWKIEELNVTKSLSGPEYFRFFNAASESVVWPRFGDNPEDVCCTLMIGLGLLAERSEVAISIMPSIQEIWGQQLMKAFKGLGMQLDPDIRRTSTTHALLKSSLSLEFKRVVCAKFAPQSFLLNSRVHMLFKEILPTNETDLFAFLPWDKKKPALNKELVSYYMPHTFPLLDLSLSDNAWQHRGAINYAIKRLMVLDNSASRQTQLTLPCDF
jgi:hypothetical protein